MSLSLSEKPAPKKAETQAIEEKQNNSGSSAIPKIIRDTLACFRSVQLAITLLALLAVATLAGVFLPQEGLVDIAQIKRDFGPNYRMMKAMGLFNVYSSYWFITLEVLFFFNLLFGSFKWLRPAALAATQKSFCTARQISAAKERIQVESSQSVEATAAQVIGLLKSARYQVHEAAKSPDGERLLYATKGNWSRFGPAVAHTGILLLLIASVYGVFTGFK
ncbi:MAG TPA: cytochrome c biogenesis protein ResB, partial [Oculatellaceae cyanobacterium]